jgi:hypothetical protein
MAQLAGNPLITYLSSNSVPDFLVLFLAKGIASERGRSFVPAATLKLRRCGSPAANGANRATEAYQKNKPRMANAIPPPSDSGVYWSKFSSLARALPLAYRLLRLRCLPFLPIVAIEHLRDRRLSECSRGRACVLKERVLHRSSVRCEVRRRNKSSRLRILVKFQR